MSTRFLSFVYAVFAVLFAGGTVLVSVAGCHAETPPVAAQTLAGVSYNPAPPLNAKATPLFDTKRPPTEARTFRVTYRGATGGMVPALFTVPGSGLGAARHPAIVVVHGLGSSKEDTVLLAVALARRGYATFAIDLDAHGERRLGSGRTIADLSLAEMRHSAAVSVTDLRRGVDYLATRPDVDKTRVGCIGISLGGVYGAVFAGVEPRIGATALWSAGGDWGILLTESRQYFAVKRRESGKTPDADTVRQVLRDVDPMTYAARIAPRPLLLLAGTRDAIVPNAATDALFDAASDPKTLERFPGGHIPDPRAMMVRTMAFFDETLKRRQ